MFKATDFEDCLLATCAKSNKCAAIVTRNKKDFLDFGITLLSPEEVLKAPHAAFAEGAFKKS